MSGVATGRRRSHLLELFIVATILPAAALGWLGWRLIEQDRQLERQRVQDLVDATGSSVTAGLERELARLERDLAAPTALPDLGASEGSALFVILDTAGTATTTSGVPLLFQPTTPGTSLEPPNATWQPAERLELVEHDHGATLRAYTVLAASHDPGIRAGALMRLARAQKRGRALDAALETYAALAASTDATILGDPADLMARWARLELLESLGRRDQLAAEGTTLDRDFRHGRWRLDRTAALTYAHLLRPWRTNEDDAMIERHVAFGDAVESVWRDWRSGPAVPARSSGRRSFTGTAGGLVVLWQEHGEALRLFVAAPTYLAASWRDVVTAPNLAVALVDDQGHPIVGEAPAATLGAAVVKPTSDTGLPWTIRVAATATPPDIAATGVTRRRLVVLGLALLAFLIPATGYLVVRTVNRDLALARQQSTFVSAVSHEFRSPLTTLSHLTSLLRSDFQPTDERRRQYYDALAHETDRLRRFVDTLLDVGRIQAGAARYRLAPIDLAPLVSSVIEEFRRDHASGGREVSFATPFAPPQVSADAEALGRALWNLLENAAKYSAEGSAIAVRLEQDEGRIAVRVIDSGAGIPPAELPFIFDQFFRGAVAAQSAIKGTGVGLAVVRHIAIGHGGDIQVQSVVGAGSTFSLLLPSPPPDEGHAAWSAS